MISHSFTLLALTLAGAAAAKPLSTSPAFHDGPALTVAPLVQEYHPHGTLNNSYIVVLKDELSTPHLQNHLNFLEAAHQANPLDAADAGLRHVYDGHIKGYAGKFSADTIELIRTLPEVAYVEKDQIVRTTEPTTQRLAPWGLARTSRRNKLTFGTFTRYDYDDRGGEGVDVYVIDTGINIDHIEFEGRAFWGKTMPQDDEDVDGNGHGTHCAGTIASRKYGVAKQANVIAVKVLGSNGSGTTSDVVGGVVWAAQAAATKAEAARQEYERTGRTAHKGSVANMSLGGGKSRALDDVVNRAVNSGMHFAVAAGNDNEDACDYSPAAAEKAVTVGASTIGDGRASFSNHGPCVDVFAPGSNILSTWTGSKTAFNIISGTSMASPHTAGLLAYLLSIYPSEQFNPDLRALEDGRYVLAELPGSSSLASGYAAAHAVLPGWISAFIPSPAMIANDDATGKPKTLTPAQLKRALLALATPGKLGELPAGSPDLLIFNNATSS